MGLDLHTVIGSNQGPLYPDTPPATSALYLPLNMCEATVFKHFAATFSLKPGTAAAGAAAADPLDRQHVSGQRGQEATRTTGGLPADPGAKQHLPDGSFTRR